MIESVYARGGFCLASVSLLSGFQIAEEIIVGIIAFVFLKQFVGIAWSVLHLGLYSLIETLQTCGTYVEVAKTF